MVSIYLQNMWIQQAEQIAFRQMVFDCWIYHACLMTNLKPEKEEIILPWLFSTLKPDKYTLYEHCIKLAFWGRGKQWSTLTRTWSRSVFSVLHGTPGCSDAQESKRQRPPGKRKLRWHTTSSLWMVSGRPKHSSYSLGGEWLWPVLTRCTAA